MIKNLNRIKRNIYSGISMEGLKIFTQFFFPPLMILTWGIENFGMWVFILSIPNIILIFNVNFNDASVNEMTILNAKRKFKKSNEIFQNTIIFVLANIMIVSFVLVLFILLNNNDFKIFDSVNIKELKIIYTLIIISVYLKLIEPLFSTCLNSVGKIFIGYYLEGYIDFLTKFSIVIYGVFNQSLVSATFIFFLFSVFKFILNYYFFIKYRNLLTFSFELVSKKQILRLFKLSLGHISDIYSNILKHSGVIFIAGIFLNPIMIGYIATVKTLFYFLPARLFGKINFAINYELANLYGGKKINQIKKILTKYILIVSILIILSFVISLIAGPFVYNYWLGNKYELNFIFLMLITLDVSIFIFRQALVSFYAAINRNIILGLSDLFFTFLGVIFLFVNFYTLKNYIFAFSILLFFSIISLIFTICILLFFNKFKKIR